MSSGQDRAGRPAWPRLRVAAFATLAVFALGILSSPADAQSRPQPQRNSSVIVDYSVLDELGPPPNVPQMLMPRPGAMTPPPPPGYTRSPVLRQPHAATDDRIRLTPPKAISKRATKRPTKARSKARAPAKATAKATTTSRTAVRRAEPPPLPSTKPPPPPKVAAPEPPAAPPPPVPPSNAARRLTPPEPATAAAPPPPPPAPPAGAANPPAVTPAPAVAAAPPARVESPPPARPSGSPSSPSKRAAQSPPAGEAGSGPASRISFDTGSARIGPDATGTLKEIAQQMAKDDKLRIQLLAYAGGTEETASQARRLSLSRALAARSYLIGEGVRSTRIDVRALGNKSDGGPPDRIDIVVTRR